MSVPMPRKKPQTVTPDAVLMKRIAKAKTALILEHPFFGSVAMNMPHRISQDVPTAATNGKEIIYNPEFLDLLTDEEVTFLVAHECAHPMFEHTTRRGERDRMKWNKAADYVINKLLTDEKIGKMPAIGLLSNDIYHAGKGTAEGVYAILPDDDGGKGKGPGEDGGPLDDCQDGGGSESERSQQESEWKVKVAQAAQAAKMMGKLSANLERFVGDILNPKVRWQDVLQRFVVKCKSDQRTWARPNRRFIAQGLYLPSVTGETLGEVVVAIDCSGSIGPRELDQFAAEIRTIAQDLLPAALHVVYFDSEVCHYDHFPRGEEITVKPHGGGGTAFSPIFRYVADKGIDPVCCVVLTDLCCNDFGDEPGYPTLWVSTMKEGIAPWGEVVFMDLDA